MPVLIAVGLCRGKRFRLRSLHLGRTKTTLASTVVTTTIVAIVAKRPLGSNTRGSPVRMTSPPWLVESRASIVSLAVQAAPMGNIMVELWSEIIIVRLM